MDDTEMLPDGWRNTFDILRMPVFVHCEECGTEFTTMDEENV
jgi:hypothetical protein